MADKDNNLSAFENERQRREWLALQRAIEEADAPAPCTNYPDAFYPDDHAQAGIEIRNAKSLCQLCPVKVDCLSYALRWEDQGVWGGMTHTERNRFKREIGFRSMV